MTILGRLQIGPYEFDFCSFYVKFTYTKKSNEIFAPSGVEENFETSKYFESIPKSALKFSCESPKVSLNFARQPRLLIRFGEHLVDEDEKIASISWCGRRQLCRRW